MSFRVQVAAMEAELEGRQGTVERVEADLEWKGRELVEHLEKNCFWRNEIYDTSAPLLLM
jgi:hypothetical protein